ncbi:MarR family transcriptional regulator [Cupriavidus sp. H19C3]
MARKPATLEMKGGKSPRQRVWEAIRKLRKGFTQPDVAEVVGGFESVTKDYITSLLRAEIIEVISEERVGICVRRTYRLVRDNGVEAPRIKRDGTPVVQGAGNESMWGTMHRMFERKDFNFRELAAFASTAAHPISEETAKAYVQALAAAGYLNCTKPAVRGRNAAPARWTLIPRMFTGPRAPMIQRTNAVFDPNQGRVVWTDTKGFESEQ